ncbi:MAG: hydrolase [Paenibacillus macerans]|uniref:Hydrolase n=1 Tax=Paenibacillus macerans TaxID=44252 RepID=A0A090ZVY1_PAEMA|nr:hydrolase [Paenibacillus macerans]KFN08296.1 isochorismatase family protein [Paenibacillus macerans]MBS5913894.1 hydrolase [Paenibacillus macerans]MCY7561905.1 hydrolase [Paenibacillus macerans]MDU7474061.1 hydrolase [Paenibacillus macerans]MEC0136175.1 hydrolase [Paenibacillus macerans]
MADAKVTEVHVEKTALVVIDLQEGIAHAGRQSAPYTSGQVIQNAGKLAQAFAEKGGFVVLVRLSFTDGKDALKPQTDMGFNSVQYPEGWERIVPELAGVKNAHLVTKRQWGAFYGTDLDLQLRRRGIDTIVLCGISTSIGVDTTAREAFQHGYQQIFAEDAMTASTQEEHEYVCKYIFPRLGKVRTSEEIVAAMK